MENIQPGKIVYSGQTKKGNLITIRYPQITDAQVMTDYINKLSNERTFLYFQGEQNTLQEETNFLESVLKNIERNKTVYLLAFHKDKLIGATQIDLGGKSSDKHVGVFGISVATEYRGEGIGKLIMALVFQQAKEYLPDLKICILSVFGDNPLAKSMYKKFGFKEYGNLTEGILHKDTYVDHIYMSKEM